MDFDAFNAGIEPGGLRSKNDIRILLCYLLCGVGAPLSRDDIVAVMYENGFANYFEVMDCLSGLSGMGSISVPENLPDCFEANEKTREISKRLNSTLPSSIREKAISSAVEMMTLAKIEKENTVEIKQIKNGYEVLCRVSGGEGKHDLMEFSLYVPDFSGANLVKKNFLRSPEKFYKMIIALSTGNSEVAEELISNT